MNHAKKIFKEEIEGIQKIETCYYTCTKTEEFILDFADEFKRIVISSTCSGHSFKFGPMTGRILADMALKGDSDVETYRDNKLRFSVFYHKGVNLLP